MVASFTIEAVDSSFALATGDNVGRGGNTSRFDDPPNASQGLTITSNDGDADPRLFEVGDAYDLAWSDGAGGSTVIEDATVIRSDTQGGDSGVIVFEGYSAGELVHVVWTPEFDLENWYWSNYGSSPPSFYISDQNAAYTHEFICFEASARIHTPGGPVPAGQLETGQTVCTWGGRAQQVLWIGRARVPGDGRAAPVRFEPGTIGNYAPLKLSPQHRVLISSAEAELQFGARQVLVPAIALIDGKAVRQVSRRMVSYVHVLLERHDILIAEGAPCESLLPGWRSHELLGAEDRETIRALFGGETQKPCHPILKRREAELVAADRRVPERAEALL